MLGMHRLLKGQRVRLKALPISGPVGTVAASSRPGDLRVLVRWNDGTVPRYEFVAYLVRVDDEARA